MLVNLIVTKTAGPVNSPKQRKNTFRLDLALIYNGSGCFTEYFQGCRLVFVPRYNQYKLRLLPRRPKTHQSRSLQKHLHSIQIAYNRSPDHTLEVGWVKNQDRLKSSVTYRDFSMWRKKSCHLNSRCSAQRAREIHHYRNRISRANLGSQSNHRAGDMLQLLDQADIF